MRGWRLGSIFGIEIRIDYSWLIIFFLILWTLTVGVFPLSLPDRSTSTYIVMGMAATVLFFASLLAHELSHSLVARSKHIKVEGITLFVFGGMAHTRMEFETPGDEFAIAIAGPISSILIGVAFGLIAWLFDQSGWSPAAREVARYLGWINVALAIFNLLPGFPLDGGRLFRAAVWKITGNLTKATRWASIGGRILGYALMLLGVLQMLAGGFGGGLWLLFIGWFVRVAADASFAQHVMRQALDRVRVAEVMTPAPETVPPDLTLQEFVDRHVLHGRHQAYPVLEDNRPQGLITLRLVRAIPRAEWQQRTVREVMTPIAPELTIAPDEPASRIVERLAPGGEGRVLVTRAGQLEGIVTRTDVTRLLQRMQFAEP